MRKLDFSLYLTYLSELTAFAVNITAFANSRTSLKCKSLEPDTMLTDYNILFLILAVKFRQNRG